MYGALFHLLNPNNVLSPFNLLKLFKRLEKQKGDEPLPLTASDKEKKKWLDHQHDLARIFLSYKFNPRSEYDNPTYVDRVLQCIQDSKEYPCYFSTWEHIFIEVDDYAGDGFDTGPGVRLSPWLNPETKANALDKETVLRWARETGASS